MLSMYQPRIITIELETRELLKNVAKKSQTYDMIIRELIALKQDQQK